MGTLSQKFGLSEENIEMMSAVFRKYPNIKKAIIYGSRAMGNYKPGSDIDLVIDGVLMNMSELLSVKEELDELQLPYKIDLCLMHEIDNENLVEHITRVGIEFYLRD
ncbi:MAG: nucleotidyltransferase domain-containing protein [Deltaproteobacteria bacterium]|nr:nucleotidyltransferase domain-containing protein [Deltaproteobacteria bacterium]